MTVERDGLYVHVAWLSKLMGGDIHCRWSPWYRARYTGYKKKASDPQIVQWTIDHTRLLGEMVDERLKLGEKCSVERKNNFKIRHPSGMTIAGTPDLVTITPDSRCTVFDAKTGQPKQSDTVQVMLYMMWLPYVYSKYKGLEVSGCVVYKNHERLEIPSGSIGGEFNGNVTHFLDIIQSNSVPPRNPSFQECRFCDIGEADCPERVTEDESASSGDIPEIPL